MTYQGSDTLTFAAAAAAGSATIASICSLDNLTFIIDSETVEVVSVVSVCVQIYEFFGLCKFFLLMLGDHRDHGGTRAATERGTPTDHDPTRRSGARGRGEARLSPTARRATPAPERSEAHKDGLYYFFIERGGTQQDGNFRRPDAGARGRAKEAPTAEGEERAPARQQGARTIIPTASKGTRRQGTT